MQDNKFFLSRDPQAILEHYNQRSKSYLILSIVVGAIIGVTSLIIGLSEDGYGQFHILGTAFEPDENPFAYIMVLIFPAFLCMAIGSLFAILTFSVGEIIAHMALFNQKEESVPTPQKADEPIVKTEPVFYVSSQPTPPKPGIYCPSCLAKNDSSRTSCRVCGASLPKSHK